MYKLQLRVLIPGAGVARLPFQIAEAFPNVQVIANEENLNLIFAANFVLNKCERINAFRIYPNISDLTNRITSSAVTTPIAFPDVTTRKSDDFGLTMVPGTFQELCHSSFEEESVDCVVTCFFLDTAHNCIEYVSLIKKVLKSDGIWINLGGLDCIYEPYDSDTSIELSLETLKKIIIDLGFLILKNEVLESFDCQDHNNSNSNTCNNTLVRRVMNCPFFVCKK